MLKSISLIVLLACFIFARDEVSVFDMVGEQNTPQKKTINIDDIKKIAPTDEPDYNTVGTQIYENIEPNETKMSVSKIKKSVYVHQIFSLDLKADTGHNLAFDLNLSINANDISWLNPKPNWIQSKKGVYDTTLWFEANKESANIEDITLILNRNGDFFQKASIKPKLPLIKNLKQAENFSNTVADNLEIKKVKSSKFDDENNLITLELEIKNGNLSSFFIPSNFQKQGIESIKGDYNNQTGNYFIIANNKIKSIEFSYYNLKEAKFKNFNLDVNVQDDDLSTQVNLNPKESEFELYKDITIYSLIAIFLLFFIFKKSYYSLIIAIVFGIYSFYDNKPFSDATLKANSEVKILPTNNSTVFYISDKPQSVKVMSKNDKYTKILLENKNIGWVKNEDME
ncbi:SH3 domain-containing protein [Campylobacter hyointestinalis]|uniref:Uncharacterized protein n=1 Tax=Campylobacter hyointestinalis subsp. hyointestinalis TaxID=91352 RepID=A0A855N3G1_CAMHY|nr:SH3 domain-containing protein [Campylobacter hyointestinalis]PPB58946.1 hypothetical protein CDQ71_01200 [Campylobacter hyointestinalis subsp. hyointestinalis]PPB60086.1 hypothetical protein CDQ70_01000 [Campylobacter hyointestinalis subsp. hyointestinalis]PPB63955.1 hypothetical protein CDQ74_03865 [Campylobacter hyointestinalis subsp. hyointestinalis]PPB73010.1 hypothetical protein CDQ78_01165 [Campylobacter hyointestinalis subsp. hyointestinalis]